MREGFNCLICLGYVNMRLKDVLVGDFNDGKVIPPKKIDECLAEARALMKKEEAVKKGMLSGRDVLEVGKKYDYEQMLKME